MDARGCLRRGRRTEGAALIALPLLVWVVFSSLVACAQQARLPEVEAFFGNGSITSPHFRLEVAASDQARQVGLMYRKSLKSDRGMIFVFPESAEHSFWMKNTYIPLDMVFVGESMEVVGILKAVPPLNEVPRTVGKESVYVVELASGTTESMGIREGDRLHLLGPLPAVGSH